MMRNNNKGFSLVELIIVVAIISLFTGIAGYGISLSSGKAADECAQKLASSIQRARTSSMGKNETKIEISKDEDGVWAQETVTLADKDTGGAGADVPQEKVKVGAKNLNVKFNGSVLSEGDVVKLEFDRSSGALKGYDSTAELLFVISKASKERKVKIVPLTGKVTVE